MQDFISRTEFEDVSRHSQTKLDSIAADVSDHAAEIVALKSRLNLLVLETHELRRMLRLMLSAEQLELLAIEDRAGVTAGAADIEVTLTSAEVDAFKTLGSAFVISPVLDGPCFNR